MSFFAYFMGAPSGQFLRLLAIGGPLRSVSSQLYRSPSDQFLRILYMGSPQTCFFAYYMGAPSDQFLRLLYMGAPHRSVSSFTIWDPLIFFLCIKLSLWSYFFNFQGGTSAPSCLPPPPPPLRAPMSSGVVANKQELERSNVSVSRM